MPTDDEILAEMAEGLEGDAFAELAANFDAEGATGMKALDNATLVRTLARVRQDLYSLNEMHGEPRTKQGRDLHSERAAVLVEMRERGML